MRNIYVISLSGEMTHLLMYSEEVTIKEVKDLLGSIGFTWKLHLYPAELSDDDSKNVELDSSVPVKDGDVFRVYVDAHVTHVIYPTKECHHAIGDLVSFSDMMYIVCLETGTRQPLDDVRRSDPFSSIHYYMDLESFIVHFPDIDSQVVFESTDHLLRYLLKESYHGYLMNQEMLSVYRRSQ